MPPITQIIAFKYKTFPDLNSLQAAFIQELGELDPIKVFI